MAVGAVSNLHWNFRMHRGTSENVKESLQYILYRAEVQEIQPCIVDINFFPDPLHILSIESNIIPVFKSNSVLYNIKLMLINTIIIC